MKQNDIMKSPIFLGGLLILVGVGAWLFVGPGSDMSGTYVGKNPSQAFLAQIVEGQSGQITGFYEEAGLSADGEAVNQDNIPLTGQRDGKTFTVTLQPSGLAHFFANNISLSGTYSGSSIILSGQGNGFTANLNLEKGSAADYANFVTGLQKQALATDNFRAAQATAAAQQAAEQEAAEQATAAAQAIATQKAQAASDLEASINNDLTGIAGVQSTMQARLQTLGSDVTKMHSITAKMQSYLAEETSYGGYSFSTGSQISVGMQNENAEETNDMIGLQNHYDMVQQSGIPVLLSHVRQNDVTCAGVNATATARASFSGPPEELSDCLALEKVTPELQQETDQLKAAYQAVFSTWQTENAKQQTIIQQSQH